MRQSFYVLLLAAAPHCPFAWATVRCGLVRFARGVRYGIHGPIGCLRTEIVRDSIEDYEYLWLAEQLWGREKALEWAEKIVTDEENFERDFANLEAVRIELGNALEAAMK